MRQNDEEALRHAGRHTVGIAKGREDNLRHTVLIQIGNGRFRGVHDVMALAEIVAPEPYAVR